MNKKDFMLPPENENSCASNLSNKVGRPKIKFSECAEKKSEIFSKMFYPGTLLYSLCYALNINKVEC